jgi:hypothetical protein
MTEPTSWLVKNVHDFDGNGLIDDVQITKDGDSFTVAYLLNFAEGTTGADKAASAIKMMASDLNAVVPTGGDAPGVLRIEGDVDRDGNALNDEIFIDFQNKLGASYGRNYIIGKAISNGADKTGPEIAQTIADTIKEPQAVTDTGDGTRIITY